MVGVIDGVGVGVGTTKDVGPTINLEFIIVVFLTNNDILYYLNPTK